MGSDVQSDSYFPCHEHVVCWEVQFCELHVRSHFAFTCMSGRDLKLLKVTALSVEGRGGREKNRGLEGGNG